MREHVRLWVAGARALLAISTLFAAEHAVPASAGPCIARSGERTAALVELYTGARCARCPAANRWLANLARRWPGDRLVPVALHVELSDYGGSNEAGTRRKLSVLQRMALLYTPRVLLQGHEFRDWENASFVAAVERINARPVQARLQVEIREAASAHLAVKVDGRILDPAERPNAVLYLAAFDERGNRAEPRVLQWQGPLAPRSDGGFDEERRLDLVPGATPRSSGVVAFVQNRRTMEVLQAVRLGFCSS